LCPDHAVCSAGGTLKPMNEGLSALGRPTTPGL
jgi:hypothetical protein